MNSAEAGSTPETIDKDTPIPYYYQMREILRQEVASGKWVVNEKLPSERILCERFGVSRPTVREALDDLVSEGLLRREKGRGTFVSEPKIIEGLLQTPFGFSDSMHSQGITHVTRVLNLETTPATATVARELRLVEGAPVILLQRVRSIFDVPILLVTSYLPARLFAGLTEVDFTQHSLYAVLRERYGMTMARARRYMEAVVASRRQADLLRIHSGDPLMLIESTTYTEDGVPFEYYVAYHRGDRTRFMVETFRTVAANFEAAPAWEDAFISS